MALKQGSHRRRWERAIADKSFENIGQLPLSATRADHFLKAWVAGKISSIVFLRRIYNSVLAMD